MGDVVIMSRSMRLSGRLTLEAALVMPMVFFVIIVMLYLSFYLYDLARIQVGIDRIHSRAMYSMNHETDWMTGQIKYEHINNRGILYPLSGYKQEEIELESLLHQELENTLIVKITDAQVAINLLDIKIVVEGYVQIPLDRFLSKFKGKRQVRYEIEVPLHQPAQFLWMSDVVIETGSKIKGMEQIKEWLEKVLKPKEVN